MKSWFVNTKPDKPLYFYWFTKALLKIKKLRRWYFFSLVRKSAVIPSARDGFESRPHRKKQFSIELLFVFYGIYRLHIAESAGWFLLHRLYHWFTSAIIGAQFRRIRLHIGKDALGSCLFREIIGVKVVSIWNRATGRVRPEQNCFQRPFG